jgi:hypothetical protein
LVYRSYPLAERHDGIRRALVVVHDITRDAPSFFQTAVAAARLAGALQDTVLIAPRFASRDGLTCADALAADEINWPCEGNSWRSGGVARGGGAVTSFDLVDEILRRVADRRVFPNLTAVVLAGHSAGGQFVTRYQMANRIHESLRPRPTYLVANPSSYAYADKLRPTSVGAETTFAPFDGRQCPGYNRWPYGLEDRAGYADRSSAADLSAQLATRFTTYLLGDLDVTPVEAFDDSCAAMAQGLNRLARGRAFAAYVNERLEATHALVVVSGCGHDARCMFTARTALPALFPDP